MAYTAGSSYFILQNIIRTIIGQSNQGCGRGNGYAWADEEAYISYSQKNIGLELYGKHWYKCENNIKMFLKNWVLVSG
jgi:hypothetical protein